MLTVAYEITALAQNPHGGIAQTCFHTLAQALAHPEIDVRALWRRGDPSNLNLSNLHSRRWAWYSTFTFPRCRIVHALCHRLPKVRADRVVYTVHDVWTLYPNPYQGPEFQRKIGRRMRHDLLRSDLVVADSEATRQRLLSLNLIRPDICHVVPLGVELLTGAADSDNPDVARIQQTPYVLFVGRLEHRKNIPHILDALRSLKDLSLVLVGEPGYGYEQLESAIETFPRDRIVRLRQISKLDLNALYRGAVATLIPSWEEGFGLPVLEAMAAGCPVVTSDRSASAEIGRDAAILVSPEEPTQSREAIMRLLDDSALRASLISAGKARAAEYSWPRYLGSLLDLYRSLA
jgi:glycosyltransferase involved in cell wall biosynthesis